MIFENIIQGKGLNAKAKVHKKAILIRTVIVEEFAKCDLRNKVIKKEKLVNSSGQVH